MSKIITKNKVYCKDCHYFYKNGDLRECEFSKKNEYNGMVQFSGVLRMNEKGLCPYYLKIGEERNDYE